MNSIDFFKKNSWIKVENVIDKNMANFLYYYVLLQEERLKYLINKLGENVVNTQEFKDHYGTFWENQVPNTFSKYGDPTFDTLLSITLKTIEELTGKKLIPTYSFHRLYKKGDELKIHKDRPSCEISGTLCLGYNISNLENKNWNWPMWVKDENNNEQEIFLEPGDMIIYKGCDMEHWRVPFTGINHAQVFFHYNEKNGKYNIEFDGRPLLGLPGSFKNIEKLDYKKVVD
jgi:hypothetical protein